MKSSWSRLILSHTGVLVAGVLLGQWIAHSGSDSAPQRPRMTGTPPAGDEKSPGGGHGASAAAGDSAPKKDAAQNPGETFIRVPIRFADQFSVSQFIDLKVDDITSEILELTIEQRRRFDELMERTSTRLKEFEFQNMTSEPAEGGGVLIKIPQMKDYARTKEAFHQELSSIIGAPKADFVMTTASAVWRVGMSGDFGEFPRDIRITPANGRYDVHEESFSIYEDGSKHNIGTVDTTFQGELPPRLKHLVEFAPKK